MWALWIGILFIPGSWVLRSVLMSHRIQFSIPNVPGVFLSYESMKYLRMCKNFNFPTVVINIYRSRTAINQSLTGRNRAGRGSCVD
jgi:hypothetical protein